MKYGDTNAQLRRAELIIINFGTTHNLSYQTTAEIQKMCQQTFLDSKLAQKILLNKDKVKEVASTVIAKNIQDNIDAKIRKSFVIQLSLDSSSKNYNRYTLPYIHFLNETNPKQVEQEDAVLKIWNNNYSHTAQDEADKVNSVFDDHKIGRQNVGTIKLDCCAENLGWKSGVFVCLQKTFPGEQLIPCYSHILSTIIRHSLKKLDDNFLQYLSAWGSYFKASPWRQNLLELHQVMTKVKPQKIIKYEENNIREWLSLGRALKSMIQNIKACQSFAKEELVNEQNISEVASKFKKSVFNPNFIIKCLFLDYLFKQIDQLQLKMQSKKYSIISVRDDYMKLLKSIGSLYPKYGINDVSDDDIIQHVTFSDKNKYIKELFDDIIFTISAQKYIEDMNSIQFSTIENLKQFMISLCEELRGSMILSPHKHSNLLQLIDYKLLSDFQFNKRKFLTISIIQTLFAHLPQLFIDLDRSQVIKEAQYYKTDQNIDKIIFHVNPSTEYDLFIYIYIKSAEKSFNYSNLSKLLMRLVSIRPNQADLARIFTITTDNWTDKRNRLTIEMLETIMIVKTNQQQPNHFEPDENMIKQCPSNQQRHSKEIAQNLDSSDDL